MVVTLAGNLRAFVQLTYREILAGKTLDKRMQPSEDIEIRLQSRSSRKNMRIRGWFWSPSARQCDSQPFSKRQFRV